MRRTWATLVLLPAIALVGLGLPAGVQAQGGLMGLSRNGISTRGGGVLVDSSGNGADGVYGGFEVRWSG